MKLPTLFRTNRAAILILAGAIVVALVVAMALMRRHPAPISEADLPASGDHFVTVIAPMIQGQSRCPEATNNDSVKTDAEADALCDRLGKNGAQGIAQTLDAVGPTRSPSGRFELGYTFIVPLLRLYTKTDGSWRLDQHAIDVALSTIQDVDRPVVLHLSATHFNYEDEAFAAELATNPRNLMWTQKGPLQSETYIATPIHAWTLADSDAPVNLYRREAFRAVLDSACRLPPAVRKRIVAVTFLGETHQLYANLQTGGSGYGNDYLITDYSPAAKAGFHDWLQSRFGNIGAFNQQVGGRFSGFQDVEPPSASQLGSPTPDRLRHLDSAAAGTIPIFGWAAPVKGPPAKVDIYLDGNHLTEITANLSRLDVADAAPEFGHRSLGFRYDLDYTKLSPGEHRLDLIARPDPSEFYLFGRPRYFLGVRRFVVLGGPAGAAPAGPHIHFLRPMNPRFGGSIDHPSPDLRVLYNPLAKLWNEYRSQQVTRFQEQFSKIAAKTCFSNNQIFSHQIASFAYEEYDPDKIAAMDSLKLNQYYNPGVTIYGYATNNDQPFEMKKSLGWNTYGIGEFNPLAKLTPEEYRAMFLRHNRAGAAYIAPFHMSIASNTGQGPDDVAAGNPNKGNGEFYKAIVDLMRTG